MIKKYLNKLKDGFLFSLEGFKHALKETAFQIELLIGIPAIIIALFSNHSQEAKALLVFSIFFIFIVELCNTAIEKLVDRFSTKTHPLSKKIKDISSCIVFVSAIAAIMIWIIIYFL
ncbi:MAG: diacylglycerol kinase [Rickettsiales bacterium]|nr:diacylglycerol kinase [Rickettsiales bacterium]